MAITYYDKSGSFLNDQVWSLIPLCIVDIRDDLDSGSIYTLSYLGEEREQVVECPVDKRHVMKSYDKTREVDLFGRDRLADFVPTGDFSNDLISHQFAESLRRSDLTGFRIREGVTIHSNQTLCPNPRLYFIDYVGNGGICRRFKIRDGDNLCPHCRREPIICHGCGTVFGRCIGCDTITLVRGKGKTEPGDKRLIDEGLPDQLIVEAREWDRSDFFTVYGSGGGWFVNRRAKDWLETHHIQGVRLEAALLNIEGVENEFYDY